MPVMKLKQCKKVTERISFHKVERGDKQFDKVMEMLDDIHDMVSIMGKYTRKDKTEL